ncbi:MAG: glycosyltransferase family 4 protein [Desulfarculaceae bacterium]|nr:glycosyltransferase family 4 protein [Desulfarculaceae bacterium]MCF8048286.1 glycosyltransferase family 4 protein [Desulfarculaceae bacterium]MCF8064741.1 glycosyltransferase family 4 protein [Desulfarculaceae bacterium]MCF8097332.1 glycosyltransferase family 4 protein [Desulfarculaceae bacterium]MCF8124329.1 glycosyltransferase family 4 protein [Desulfarculaceae bacterium]
MKPLNIIHSEWSNGWGGQEIRILTECLGMAGRGHRVALVGCPTGKLRLAAQAEGLTFHSLDMRGPWDLPAILKLRALLKSQGTDILHTHSSVDGWVGGMAARWAGVASLRTRHLSAKVPNHPFNIVYRLPQAVVTTGESIRRHLVEDYGLAPEQVVSIPTGIDVERYAPRDAEPGLAQELGLTPGEPVVAIVAILRSWKRHDLFLAMAKELLGQGRRAQFLIVGGGPKEQEVRGLIQSLGLGERVVMTGMRPDVERLLPLCDVCVLASDKNEGVPQAVLQQMAAQRPVVAAKAGDVGQVVIDGQTGLLVETGSASALTAGVARVLDDPELAARLGQGGRRLVLERYSMEAMLDATENIYDQVLAGRTQ